MASHSRKTEQKITRGLLSQYPLIYVLGWEEERIERVLNQVTCAHFGEDGHLLVWSHARGFTKNDETVEAITDPTAALAYIANASEPTIYLMKDLPAWFSGNPALVRAAREVYYRLRNKGSHVFLTHPELILPEALKKEVFLIEMDLPTEEEILEFLRPNETLPGVSRDQLHRIAGAMKGLSLNEVDHLQARIFRGEDMDPSQALIEIHEEKAQLLKKESCLRFFPSQHPLDAVGGLENLKDWVLKRKDLFSEKAYEAGIPLPSGILLMGVSGCGKSMAAKAIAAAWDLPLVRLDMSSGAVRELRVPRVRLRARDPDRGRGGPHRSLGRRDRECLRLRRARRQRRQCQHLLQLPDLAAGEVAEGVRRRHRQPHQGAPCGDDAQGPLRSAVLLWTCPTRTSARRSSASTSA